MGAIGYLCRRKRGKPFQTVEIKVKMDCDGCVRKVKNAVTSIKGVRSVEVSKNENRVTVTGNLDPEKVLKKVRKTGKKRAEFWPYIRYNLVSYPYVVGAYDRKAPAGYVRNVASAFPGGYDYNSGVINGGDGGEALVCLFNDENTSACSIM